MYDQGDHTKPCLKVPGARAAADKMGLPREQARDDLQAQAMLWATPSARDWRSDQSPMTDEELYGTKGRPLARQATVTYPLGLPVQRSESGGPKSLSGGPNSPPLWATQNAADGTGGHYPSEVSAQRGGNRTLNRNLQEMGYPLRLNPLFVEWLMGLPCSWTVAVPGAVRAFGVQRDTPECTD